MSTVAAPPVAATPAPAAAPAAADLAQQAIDTAAASSAAGATPAPAVAEPVVYNAFAAEDAAAEKVRLAVEAEQKAKQEQGTAGTPAAATPAAAAPAAAAPGVTPATTAAAATSKNTLESAVIGLRRKLGEETRARLMAEGEARALRGLVVPGQPAGEGATPGAATPAGEQTIAEQRDVIDGEELAIAEQVDRGALSEREAAEKRIALRKRERELNAQEAEQIADARANEQANTPTNDTAQEQHIAALVTDFPVLNALSVEKLDRIRDLVYDQAEINQRPIAGGALGTRDLRERMAIMAEQLYDPAAAVARMARTPAKGVAASSVQPNGTATPPGGAQPTAGQREAKLALAASLPPDAGRIGAAAPAGELSVEAGEQQYLAIKNDDERIKWLDAHPSFKAKVMGNSFR